MGFFNGENLVKLVGKATKIKYTMYNNGGRFTCVVAVPTPDGGNYQYVNVSVWGDMAEQLSELKNNSWIKIFGHIEKRSYNTNCRYCGGESKVYWTDISIDNYVLLNGDK